ncbi:unnamed protein product [Acanthoscelides obtectus]|uniref:Uncharacterized protein n=1 Tax=Acanthoscelides obtectus TaxID=200917 RepID=A0A9P0LC37_ACAOB|nr:unnamed protein product [Acanthoscelides obtectus]
MNMFDDQVITIDGRWESRKQFQEYGATSRYIKGMEERARFEKTCFSTIEAIYQLQLLISDVRVPFSNEKYHPSQYAEQNYTLSINFQSETTFEASALVKSINSGGLPERRKLILYRRGWCHFDDMF